jgi:histone acetyltransferase
MALDVGETGLGFYKRDEKVRKEEDQGEV